MSSLLITGGKKLAGEVKIAGNKNSVLPIMTAAMLSEEKSTIYNVPLISDVVVMADLMEMAGAKVEGIGTDTISIDPQHIKSVEFPHEMTEKLRASVLLLAPVLVRAQKVTMGYPGGDVIGRRPLNAHIQALEALGAKTVENNNTFSAEVKIFRANEIFLEEASVTATENALMAAVLAQGTTVIKRAASEPHVVDLCEFLIKMGAKIDGVGSNILKIHGVKKLNGASHEVRPDHIEAGTFMILAAVTRGQLTLSPIIEEDLQMTLLTLKKFGVKFKVSKNSVEVYPSDLKAVEKVVTDVWPGFPTDLMAPMIVLATQAKGVTILHDWMYESRMFFVDKLLSMGAKVEIADPHRVLVYGPSSLRGQRLDTPDIRAGMALVIAALIAKGKSRIDKAHLIERGYENLVERLTALGADVKKLE